MNLRYCLAVFFLTITFYTTAQRGLKQFDQVPDFKANLILNHPTSISNFSSLTADITILDFFGTWCAPCLKAIPHLNQLKEKFTNKIAIILISTEEETQLRNFLKKNTAIRFPLIVDKDEIISQQFMPPAYPYSVIIDKSGKILSLTNAANIKEDSISYWLAEKKQMVFETVTNTQPTTPIVSATNKPTVTNNVLVRLSQELLYAARTGSVTTALTDQLAAIPTDSVTNQLITNDSKKAFWINLYNAFILLQLKKDASAYKRRAKFFSASQIIVANTRLSFDDIEHGILRRSQVKWGLGYIRKLFPKKIEKNWRVDSIDYRIHFALNCGASSCPPIAFYDDSKINTQLNSATAAYLQAETKYDTLKNSVTVPKLFSWFRGDFGGKQAIRNLLKQLHLIPENTKPSIRYAPYNWELNLQKFTN